MNIGWNSDHNRQYLMVEIPNLWPEVDAKLRFFLDFLLTNWINIQGKMNFLQSRLAVVLGLKPQTFLKCLVVLLRYARLNCGFSMSLLLDLIQKPKVKSESNIFLSSISVWKVHQPHPLIILLWSKILHKDHRFPGKISNGAIMGLLVWLWMIAMFIIDSRSLNVCKILEFVWMFSVKML